ncbi:MAG: NADH dehydrogenase [Bacteroidetes bacterium]|nr:NADH dehydrogenase [Bacteroidota bacterium]MBK9516434.1 NADH dehydrogenase [Anaeromyxobacter sp.]MBL0275665.1 NADH dehydrogenase [Anaeromyxobacter sp.]
MPTSLALALPTLVPLLLALALLARPLAGPALRAAPLAALPALAVALAWPDGAADLPWLLLGTRLRLDPAARTFLLAAGAVWLAAGLYASAYLAHDPRRRAFFTSWCLALAGNSGLVVAGDAASFYLCFALMSFASYGLVVHTGTAAAVRAGRVYLALVVVGEVFVFAALALGAQAAGSLRLEDLVRAGGASPQRDLIVLCALLGFGVKAGALGLHVWLPLAHPEAPTPASAVLSGVMVKAAVVGWLAVLPAAALPGAGHAVLALGVAGALSGVAVGLTQRDPKAILAYSTVSQMGLLIAGVGAALSDPASRAAAATVLPLFALHHGLAKGALFLGTGVARGAGAHRRLALASLTLPALALAAAPFTSGALAKGALKALVEGSGAGGPAALVLLSLSSAGTVLLLGHLLRTLHLEPALPGAHLAGPGELLPYLGLVAAAGAVPFLVGSPGALADRVLEGAWPLALGAAAGVAFAGFPPWPVPPGDVLALYERLASRIWRPVAAAPGGAPRDPGPWLRLASAWAAGAEARLLAGVGSGAALAALLGALHLLLGR